jgi:hypothetical protein
MNPEVLKGFARIGILVGGGGLIFMLAEPRSSPEFIVSVCSALIGGILLIGVVVLRWWMR